MASTSPAPRSRRGSIPVLVPYIGLGLEKRRLAWALSPRERSSLAAEMLDIVVGAIREAPGTTPVVVSPDSALDHRARRLGARFLRQHGIGLNQALEVARECLRADGYRRIAVMHGDLPFVTAADVAALVTSLPEVGVSIAPDLAGSGTNALCLRADDQLPFCFGADSYRRFHDEAAAIGATVTSVERNGLAFDLDSVDALRIFRRAQRSTAPLMEVG